MTTLNGRITRLEAIHTPPAGADGCRGCGLRHVRPLTLALVRGVLRVAGGAGRLLGTHQALCLCAPCCGSDRWLARLSHGLPPDESAA